MDKTYRFKGSLPLLLISAILILCAGFFILSCGKPQQKTKNTNVSSYAIDLSKCATTGPCVAYPEGSQVTPVPDLTGRSLTIEAWVQNKSTSTAAAVSGGIFARFDTVGAVLYVKDGAPKFGIGRPDASPEPAGCTPKGTSTECVISSGVIPDIDQWTHVAGVLVNESHSHLQTADCTSAVMLEKPHMDIYINGEFKNCSTTKSLFAGNPGDEKMTIGVTSSTTNIDGVSGKFQAAIDEIRFWGYARSPLQISRCLDRELGIGGDCDRGDSGLITYYRLNEGEGADVTDISGNQFSGAFEDGNLDHWEDGWILRTDALTPERAD